jgi:hypothetical protein
LDEWCVFEDTTRPIPLIFPARRARNNRQLFPDFGGKCVRTVAFLLNVTDEANIETHTHSNAKDTVMIASEARIASSRQNGKLSKGPSAEGKIRSRRNGLKHGMTGKGIVIHEADAPEVKQRLEALQAELAPKSVMGAILLGQMATLSVRMERGARQEFAAVAIRARHASDDFDAARSEAAKDLFKTIGDDPRAIVRKLLKSPEGVDVMDEAWQDLRAKLTRESGPSWGVPSGLTMANLLGCRENDPGAARIMALTKGSCGQFFWLADSDGGDLEREARQAWACARLLERVDAEIAELEAHYETLDFETIELDRAEAGARASFDPSKEATLARRYESEARRGFFKSLKEFHKAEAEAADRVESAPPASAKPQDSSLGSCRDETSPEPDEFDNASRAVSLDDFSEVEVAQEQDGQPSRAGQAVPVAA